jgi:metallo-beta-lactamase family protein
MVTGSSYLLTDGSTKVLLDLGMFQGGETESRLNYEELAFDSASLNGVVLTHAHLDHCGRLPILMHGGFSKSIFMTEATERLLEITLMDSAHLAKENQLVPLYDEEDVIKLLSLARVVGYEETFTIDGFEFKFLDAGHILGSASVEIKLKNSRNQELKRIVFSGDLGNSPQDLIKPTVVPKEAEVVIMESTYGDKIHPEEDVEALMTEEIKRIEEDGGTLLIPAFSLERSQELLHLFDHLKKSKKMKDTTPVYLDSPMAIRATEVFESSKDLFNEELLNHSKVDNPFQFPGLIRVEKGWQSKKIKDQVGAKVIIAGAGMMTGGRIVFHAIDFLGDEKNSIMFVGFQGEGTLGRRIQEGEKRVNIEGKTVEIKARVREIRAMSAHADQNGLISWISKIDKVKKIFLTHGEELPRLSLSRKIIDQVGISEVVLPKMRQEVEV